MISRHQDTLWCSYPGSDLAKKLTCQVQSGALHLQSSLTPSRSAPTASSCAVCCAESLSRVQLFATPWTGAHQAPLPTEFSRQEYWSGLPRSPLDLPKSGIKPKSPTLHVDSLPSEPPRKPTASSYCSSNAQY